MSYLPFPSPTFLKQCQLPSDRARAAEGALEQTGLPGEYAPSYALHGAADGRDSFAQTVFRVEREREELLQRMSRTEGGR